ALVLTVGHAVIGFIDDYIKVVMKRNLGLTAKQKFFLQFILAGAYVYFAETHIRNTELWVPGINAVIDLGWGYYVLAFLLLVGTTNAVNLTDGLDGLVSFVSLPVTMVFAFIAYMQGMLDLSGFSLGLTGACLGFLLFNRHPARVFMGDTGSLALGGAIAALALLTRTELLLVIVGGIYVAEALSVIIQVTYFRFSGGKRIFRMSPLHHHFELGGWPEVKVVRVFTAVSCVLSVIGLCLWLNAFV
ncbi:phospho-N-acetylmuramoyl-pentapeptide-transferase, partial [Phascolarctobacterium succinatutens]|uniref:phospho-N-acetylmuramoyl-pentapeptide- transferase n=1 Tax=Phascolarctobacterium succinatutens TaxID=626940 RepID=UPI00307C3FD4